MRIINIFLILILPSYLVAQGIEEFNGPMKSWINAKDKFHVKGDSHNDDTEGLQKALDELADKSISFTSEKYGAYSVFYLPKGVYCISETLKLKGKVGVIIIGENPENTIIKWCGKNDDTLFWANGSAYFKLSRISWDPNGRINMEGVGIHWKDKWRLKDSRSYASLNIEVSDCIFLPGFKIGIGGGSLLLPWTRQNDSEIAIKRCTFFNCLEAGISITGHNALDYWIWDSKFIDCNIAISNNFGNYHAYRCSFLRSKSSDFHQSNGYYTSVRWCNSQNSKAFSLDAGSSSNPFKRIFQGNNVLNPEQMAIEFYHMGRITLFDNYIGIGKTAKFPYAINQRCWSPGIYGILSINNVFASNNPIRLANNPKLEYRILDNFTSQTSAKTKYASIPASTTPGYKSRPIIEVPTNSGYSIIQNLINQAAKLVGSRPIVHFPIGQFTVDSTIVIPSGTDMQICGDGFIYSSKIVAGPKLQRSEEPIFLILGPSTISIHDIQIGNENGVKPDSYIVFKNVDQKGALAILDQIYSMCDTTLFLKGNNYLTVQKENSFFSAGNYINGGRLQKKGLGESRVISFGGQIAKTNVENGGVFIAKDIWWEGPERTPLNLTGSGTISIDGAMIAPNKADSTVTINIGKFKGKISLLNMYVQGAIDIDGNNSNLKFFGWNLNFYHKMNPLEFLNTTTKYSYFVSCFSSQCFDKREVCTSVPLTFGEYSKNISNKQDFILEMTKPDREAIPMIFDNKDKGVSNIMLSRVSIGKGAKAISFLAN